MPAGLMMAKNVEQVMAKAADSLMQAVEAYGPKATALVMETGRVAAMQELVTGFVFLLVLLIACGLGAFCAYQAVQSADEGSGDVVGWGVGTMICFLGAIICTIGTLVNLVNMFAWVGIRHPEIYLAAKLLKL